MAVEQVLIEFISDTSQLEPASDQLVKMGKVEKTTADQFKATNAEIQKQVKTLDSLNATTQKLTSGTQPLKKTLADLNTQVKGLSQTFMKDFQQGAAEALQEAGVSAEEFEAALEGATKETTSLKAQLREMVAELAAMKVAGQDNTEQYQALAQKAGHLKDAIADANQEVKNFGSDTSTIDGLISLVGGLAGGFAVVQGAAALFGDESEELQKTLLKVNAAMAVLQGLQQLQVTLQKESAAATLANTIATKAQTAAQALFTFVVGSSTGALKAFRIALATTGVGLLVIGIIELVSALKSSNDELEVANSLLETQAELIEAYNKGVQEGVSIQEARARAAGKLESDIIKIQGQGLQLQRKNLIESNAILAAQRDQLDQTSEAWGKLNSKILENNETINEIDNDVLVKHIDFEAKLIEERLKAIADTASAQLAGARKNSSAELAIRKQLIVAERDVALNAAGQNEAERQKIIAESNKKIRDAERDFQVVLQNDRIAATEAALDSAQAKARQVNERITQEEIDLQKKLVQEKADLELLQEGLTANQILDIKTKSLNAQLKLQKDFNKQQTKEALEDIVSSNNKQLDQLEVSDKKRLALTIENITAQAKIEVEQSDGSSKKIQEINAKRDKAIRDARVASIQATVEYEIQLFQSTSGAFTRGLERQLDQQAQIRNAGSKFEEKQAQKRLGVEKLSVDQQIQLIDLLTRYQENAIQKRIDALNDERAQGLISQKDYNLQYEGLVDEQAKIQEDAEKKKQDLIAETNQKAKEQAIQLVQTTLDAASQVVGVLDSLFQLQAQKENDSLAQRKEEIDKLREAGAITEKEAVARTKRLEADERRIRQQQAQREKQIAIFNAAIAVPQAVLKGLATGGPILAAVYGAIALAQLLIVSSRPVPKFAKGKKDKYEGPGLVGEAGAELIQSGGRMYVANKPEIVWLGRDDKVFNPQETIEMLSHGHMNTERLAIPAAKGSAMKIDYEKFGKAVAKHVSTNVFVDGVQEAQIKQKEFTHWQTKRRSWL